jgi:hypothetical protein
MTRKSNNLPEDIETQETKVIEATDDIYQLLLFRVYEKRLPDF